MTTPAEFRATTSAAVPPKDIGPALEALWRAARGEWDAAHRVVQGHEGEADCDWVHAHLHRQEGDLDNARYWYGEAKRAFPEPYDLKAELLALERAVGPA